MTERDVNWRLAIYSALAVYVGLRLPGSYYIIFAVALVTLIANRRGLPECIDQQLACLALYSLLLVMQAVLSIGGGVSDSLLAKRGQLLLPINIFMLFTCGRVCSLDNFYASVSLLALSLSAAYGSAATAILSLSSPASQLRPLENVYAIGCLCLAIWLFYNNKRTNITTSKRPVRFAVVVAFFCVPLVAALPAFRGVLSILAYAVLLSAVFGCFWSLFVCNQNVWFSIPRLAENWRLKSLIFASLLVILIAYSGKGSVFRYTLYQFINPNPLNGRADLLGRFAEDLSESPFVLLGTYPVVKMEIWSHNYIVDTIAYHGWVPAFFLVMFLVILIGDLRESSYIVKAVVLVMGVGALLQPIEFADGIAFQLSFFLIGLLKLTSPSLK